MQCHRCRRIRRRAGGITFRFRIDDDADDADDVDGAGADDVDGAGAKEYDGDSSEYNA